MSGTFKSRRPYCRGRRRARTHAHTHTLDRRLGGLRASRKVLSKRKTSAPAKIESRASCGPRHTLVSVPAELHRLSSWIKFESEITAGKFTDVRNHQGEYSHHHSLHLNNFGELEANDRDVNHLLNCRGYLQHIYFKRCDWKRSDPLLTSETELSAFSLDRSKECGRPKRKISWSTRKFVTSSRGFQKNLYRAAFTRHELWWSKLWNEETNRRAEKQVAMAVLVTDTEDSFPP